MYYPTTIMTKCRGHFCRICGGLKPNEAFSGKGHRIHVCKKCARLPKEKREEIEYKDEIFNYLRQSRISDKNVSRLKKLAESPNEQVAELAGIVLEVAEIKPYKTRRLRELARKKRNLLQKLEETGLILAHGL
ncbi:hypothetical protein ACFL5F_08965 [Planctomycetota bacterium]